MRLFLREVISVYIFVGICQCALSQQPAYEEAGVKPFGSYDGSSVESVNVENGELNLRVPLYSLPERGKLHLSFSLSYQDVGYQLIQNCPPGGGLHESCDTDTEPTNTTWGVQPIADQQIYVQEYSVSAGSNGDNGNPYFYTTFDLKDATGAVHNLAYDGTMFHAIDGSGWAYIYGYSTPPYWPLSSSQPTRALPNGTAIDSDGTQYTIQNGGVTTITDVDGNIFGGSGSDSLNRPISSPPDLPSTTSTAGCPAIDAPNQPLAGSATWTPPGYQGSASYLFCFATMTVSTGVSAPPYFSQYHLSPTVLQSIVLADGTYWGFVYASADPSNSSSIGYGDLVQLIYPTGGSVSYSWTSYDPYCEATATNPVAPEAISTRTVVSNGVQNQWTYSYVGGLTANPVTTITDPLGNQVVHTFTDLSNGNCNLYETNTQYNQKTSTGSLTTLKTTTTAYRTESASYQQGNAAAYPSLITEVLANGQPAQTTFSYDNGYSYVSYECYYDQSWACLGGTGGTLPYGKQISTSSYDFGGALLSQTQTQYEWQTNSAYVAANLLDTPSLVTVSGPSGQFAQTSYTYDESAKVRLTPSPAITTQLGAPPDSVYGHVTTVSQWLSGGTSPSGSTYWLNTGEVDHVVDPKGNTTSFAYSPTYDGAYLTQTTNAKGRSSTTGYDFNTGLMTSTIDVNSEPTMIGYDSMNRVTSVNYPDGGQTMITYNPSGYPVNSVLTKILLCNGSSSCSAGGQTKSTLGIYDGLGRMSESELLSDPVGADIIVTAYDSLGRVASVTNPYRSGDPIYSTSYTYDALGRKIVQTQQDQSTLQWCYNGVAVTTQQTNCGANRGGEKSPVNLSLYPWTDYSDETGKHWQQISDALGRLAAVMEPDSSNTPTIETDYWYNPLGDLTHIDQWGGSSGSSGDRVRAFAYDSLSRLVASNNPENSSAQFPAALICASASGTWAMCYGYDPNGNLMSRTDNRNITTTYGYDVLNRMISKTYTDGTPTAHFNYDESTVTVGVVGSNQHSGPYTLQNTIGRLSSEYTGASEPGIAMKAFSYDPMGRPTGSPECGGNGCSFIYGTREPSQSYDLAGDVISFDLGTDQQLNYTYDNAGRVTSLSTAASGITTQLMNRVSYTPWGAVSARNGAESWAYDNRMRLTNYTQQDGSDLSVIGFSQALQYYPNSTLETSTETVRSTSWTWQYQYDNVNRLYTAVAPALQQGCIETIDNWGNRTAQAPSGGTGYTCPGVTGASNANNQIAGQSYDAAGNMLQDISGNVYTYDAEGRITSITSEGNATYYTYRADGLRATKQAGSSTTETYYTYGFDNSLVARYLIGPGATNGGQTENQEVWINGQHLGTIPGVSSSGAFARSAVDQVGSERLSTDPSGNIYAAQRSFPFGDGLTKFMGPWTTTLYFTGKERDTESQNDYFGGRYYSSSMGRFMTPDPSGISYADPNNPQSLNSYAYADNNPLSFIDPSGLALEYNCTGGYTDSSAITTSDGFTTNVMVHGNTPNCTVYDDGIGRLTSTIRTPLLPFNPPPLAPSNPCAGSALARRIATGIQGAANLGIAGAKIAGVGAADILLVGGGAAGTVFTGGASDVAAGLAAGAVTTYGVTSASGQAVSGFGQLYSAFTGNTEAGEALGQGGDILAGPIGGIGTLALGGSAATAQQNAQLEGTAMAGNALVGSKGFGDFLTNAADFTLSVLGMGGSGCH
jgi:RHS repeat-associated protein